MKCPRCHADLVTSEHLPTDECGTYMFACGSSLEGGVVSQSKRCEEQTVSVGKTVRKLLSNGKVGDRLGKVISIYDGDMHALVRWESTHQRLAYRTTRDLIEELRNLKVEASDGL